MPFDPTIATVRFGTGLSPLIAGPVSAEAMLAALTGPDLTAAEWPIPTYPALAPDAGAMRTLIRARNQARAEGQAARVAALEADVKATRNANREIGAAAFVTTLIRGAVTTDVLRERLTAFWADHFTVKATQGAIRHLVTPYVEEAIRPRVAGRFADLLRAAVTHPMMLLYLNQSASVGPTSRAANGGRRGLNENLARELLELHTIGVGAAYGQDDVRELAELLTGLSVDSAGAFGFDPRKAEPGAETVLGVTYGEAATLENVVAALDDIAVHPATAQHIAHKLAVHFVADTPDPALVDALAATFAETGGDLAAVYATMLAHPAAWAPERAKVKPPVAYLTSALRALAVPPQVLTGLARRDRIVTLERPLRIMGQDWENPLGPNGWPEDAAAWITPQGMAGRIDWALSVPEILRPDLPDPRDFVRDALGDTAPEAVIFAAGAAQTRAEGVAMVLSSPAFQRR